MSACYEEWARGVTGDASTLALIDRLPPAKRQPNLVFSAARFRGATTGPYPAFADWLHEHWNDVEETCLSHATQTNEAGRCATLLPALAAIGGPLALIEVGASAGLCLYPDRYSYRYRLTGNRGDGDQGQGGRERMLHPASGESAVVLDCAVSGPAPIPDHLPEIVWRAGIDLNPLDVNNADDVDWLDALIWPEHHDRRVRLRAAVDVARTEQAEIVRGDANAEIEKLVARAPAGASVVVFHTAVLAYFDEAARREFTATMGRLPVHWLANEGQPVVPGVMERLDAPPEDSTALILAQDGEPIAFTQPHGRAMHWLGSAL